MSPWQGGAGGSGDGGPRGRAQHPRRGGPPHALRDPLLAARGLAHGFGLRGDPGPDDLERPRQVHGSSIHRVAVRGDAAPVEADGIVCSLAGVAIGVVTADCVPILLAGRKGPAGCTVAAVHAGWRGLCSGVVAAGVASLLEPAVVAAIGPHVGPCCYEVDAPVLAAVGERFGPDPPAGAVRPGRAEHAWLDLGLLAAAELQRAGVPPAAISRGTVACTACDPQRFHSYRRDGPRSGRLVHFIRVPPDPGGRT